MSEKDTEVVAEAAPEVTPTPENNEPESVAKAEFETQLVELQKANKELLERVEKAEQIAKAERDARERAEWVEKAATYAAIPVQSGDLAEQLHFLHKSDPARAEFWMETLKAVDAQLKEAGLFAEVGTSESGVAKGSTDALDAVLKSGDVEAIRDAYLAMGDKKGYDYLEDRRSTIARRGR